MAILDSTLKSLDQFPYLRVLPGRLPGGQMIPEQYPVNDSIHTYVAPLMSLKHFRVINFACGLFNNAVGSEDYNPVK
jgi:hypothetical protein